MMRWLAPFSPAAREDWPIKTPSGIKAVINQAQKNQKDASDPNLENTIRILLMLCIQSEFSSSLPTKPLLELEANGIQQKPS